MKFFESEKLLYFSRHFWRKKITEYFTAFLYPKNYRIFHGVTENGKNSRKKNRKKSRKKSRKKPSKIRKFGAEKSLKDFTLRAKNFQLIFSLESDFSTTNRSMIFILIPLKHIH